MDERENINKKVSANGMGNFSARVATLLDHKAREMSHLNRKGGMVRVRSGRFANGGKHVMAPNYIIFQIHQPPKHGRGVSFIKRQFATCKCSQGKDTRSK